MFQYWKLVPFMLLVIGCSAQTPPSYQADRAPQDRDSYNGIAGVLQWQKDQSYLADKELNDKCEQFKNRIVQAQLTQNDELAEQLLRESRTVCRT